MYFIWHFLELLCQSWKLMAAPSTYSKKFSLNECFHSVISKKIGVTFLTKHFHFYIISCISKPFYKTPSFVVNVTHDFFEIIRLKHSFVETFFEYIYFLIFCVILYYKLVWEFLCTINPNHFRFRHALSFSSDNRDWNAFQVCRFDIFCCQSKTFTKVLFLL